MYRRAGANETDEMERERNRQPRFCVRPVKFSARYANRSLLFSHRRYVRTRFKSVRGPDLQVESRETRVIHARAWPRIRSHDNPPGFLWAHLEKRPSTCACICVWVEGTSNPDTVVVLYNNRRRNDAWHREAIRQQANTYVRKRFSLDQGRSICWISDEHDIHRTTLPSKNI